MGRDVLGIAKTGSGKTAAFVWPMITHILDQPALDLKDGPIGIILAPTRELALQIHTEVRRFGRPYGIRVVCCYGGGSKWEQSKALEEGAEIVVATPGNVKLLCSIICVVDNSGIVSNMFPNLTFCHDGFVWHFVCRQTLNFHKKKTTNSDNISIGRECEKRTYKSPGNST